MAVENFRSVFAGKRLTRPDPTLSSRLPDALAFSWSMNYFKHKRKGPNAIRSSPRSLKAKAALSWNSLYCGVDLKLSDGYSTVKGNYKL